MSRRSVALSLILVVAAFCFPALGAPFVLFPKAGQLMSPDGRFVVRNVERESAAGEFVGTFRALWLTELASGRSRRLCDYLGVAAVSWSKDDYLVITQYVGKRTSRALVISAPGWDNGVLLDARMMIPLLPVELREPLRDNDHVFVEASTLEGDTLHLRVWGYGRHDPNGFRWHCEYGLRQGGLACREEPKSRQPRSF